jgi:hypothetical protein
MMLFSIHLRFQFGEWQCRCDGQDFPRQVRVTDLDLAIEQFAITSRRITALPNPPYALLDNGGIPDGTVAQVGNARGVSTIV